MAHSCISWPCRICLSNAGLIHGQVTFNPYPEPNPLTLTRDWLPSPPMKPDVDNVEDNHCIELGYN